MLKSMSYLSLDGSGGFLLQANDYLFLCTEGANVWLTMTIDSQHQLSEVDEMDNDIVMSGITVNRASCPGEKMDSTYHINSYPANTRH